MNKVILHRISSHNAKQEEIVVDLDAVVAALPYPGRTEIWLDGRSLFVTEGMDHFKKTTQPVIVEKAKAPHISQIEVEEEDIPAIEAPKLPVKAVKKSEPAIVQAVVKAPSNRMTSSAI